MLCKRKMKKERTKATPSLSQLLLLPSPCSSPHTFLFSPVMWCERREEVRARARQTGPEEAEEEREVDERKNERVGSRAVEVR